MENNDYVTIVKPTPQQIYELELPFKLTEEERKSIPPVERKLYPYQENSVPDVIHGMKLSSEDKYMLVVDHFFPSDQQESQSTRKQFPNSVATYRLDDDGRLIVESVKAQEQPAVALRKDEVEFLTNKYQIAMKNSEFIKNQMTYLGFGDKTITGAFDKAVEQGHERFTLTVKPQDETLAGNKARFELNFNKSGQSDMYFFNTFKTTLFDKTDNPLRSQTFHTNATKGVTAKESINLLEGRAVKTVLNYNGEDSKVYAKLNFEETNKHGNFKYKTFNENYGVDIKDIIANSEAKSGLKIDNATLDNFAKSLEKGNLVKSNFLLDTKEASGYVTLNPEFKNLDYFNSDLKKLNSKRLGDQAQQAIEKEETTVSVKVDSSENRSNNFEPVVLAKLSEKQIEKGMEAIRTDSNKLPSVTPKQLQTVPVKVGDIEIDNAQRKKILFGLSVKLPNDQILVQDRDTNELHIGSLPIGDRNIKRLDRSEVTFDAKFQNLKPFESQDEIPERSNSISR